MITAKEIDEKRFEQARPGYRPDEVDAFLREVSESFKQIVKEKEDIEKKMGFLVETVKRYKSEEDAIKDAMILAQKQSREINAEAQQKAERIIAEANVRRDEIVSSASRKLEKEQAALETLRREVSDFRGKLLDMYREHLGLINNIPEYDDEDEEEEYDNSTPTVSLTKIKAEDEEPVISD